jgi:hypothetical protein
LLGDRVDLRPRLERALLLVLRRGLSTPALAGFESMIFQATARGSALDAAPGSPRSDAPRAASSAKRRSHRIEARRRTCPRCTISGSSSLSILESQSRRAGSSSGDGAEPARSFRRHHLRQRGGHRDPLRDLVMNACLCSMRSRRQAWLQAVLRERVSHISEELREGSARERRNLHATLTTPACQGTARPPDAQSGQLP